MELGEMDIFLFFSMENGLMFIFRYSTVFFFLEEFKSFLFRVFVTIGLLILFVFFIKFSVFSGLDIIDVTYGE